MEGVLIFKICRQYFGRSFISRPRPRPWPCILSQTMTRSRIYTALGIYVGNANLSPGLTLHPLSKENEEHPHKSPVNDALLSRKLQLIINICCVLVALTGPKARGCHFRAHRSVVFGNSASLVTSECVASQVGIARVEGCFYFGCQLGRGLWGGNFMSAQ